jgi:sugar lactone lactonase YvrE
MNRMILVFLTIAGSWVGCSNKYVLGPLPPTPTPAPASASQGVTVYPFSGQVQSGFKDGSGGNAQFNDPSHLAVDSSDNIYVADTNNNAIRKITPGGIVSTFAGQLSGASGSTNGIGTSASFYWPSGLAFDNSGNVYVADFRNDLIRMITPAGMVSTVAAAQNPTGLAVDSVGNIYVADVFDCLICKISNGILTTLAGSGISGYKDGTGTAAEFFNPQDLCVDPVGNVYVADGNNNRVRKVTPAGVVTTVAGSGKPACIDGVGTAASFNSDCGIVMNAAGNLFVSDLNENGIREVTLPGGVVSTYAGASQTGVVNGPAAIAEFDIPVGLAVNSAGHLFVADEGGNNIRVVY